MSVHEKRRGRRRGTSLCECVYACALATAILGIAGVETLRQRLELTSARGEARARAALLTAYDRLRAGTLDAPGKGPASVVSDGAGLRITVERGSLPAGSRLETMPGLVPVVVRATWRDFDGKPRSRELTTIVADGQPDAKGGGK